MAKDETRRVSPALLDDDKAAFAALKKIDNYAPANPEFVVQTGSDKAAALAEQYDLEAQAEVALKTARDNAVAAEWDFHNYILGVKKQVVAQYGDSSNEIQSLGLKKKTEYKNPKKGGGDSAAKK